MLMVFVQPSVFTRREHRDNDEAGVDVAECQGVECQERTKLCLVLLILSAAYIVSSSYNPFIYFAF